MAEVQPAREKVCVILVRSTNRTHVEFLLSLRSRHPRSAVRFLQFPVEEVSCDGLDSFTVIFSLLDLSNKTALVVVPNITLDDTAASSFDDAFLAEWRVTMGNLPACLLRAKRTPRCRADVLDAHAAKHTPNEGDGANVLRSEVQRLTTVFCQGVDVDLPAGEA